MSYEEKFSGDIAKFERYGTYSYEYDEAGNIILNSNSFNFSNIFIAFNLINFKYDENKITSFYDSEFKEFIPTEQTQKSVDQINVDQIQEELTSEKLKNEELTSKLNDLIDQTNNNDSTAKTLATKQVILELRKALKQGNVDSDFSEDFPYAPIKKQTNIIQS